MCKVIRTRKEYPSIRGVAGACVGLTGVYSHFQILRAAQDLGVTSRSARKPEEPRCSCRKPPRPATRHRHESSLNGPRAAGPVLDSLPSAHSRCEQGVAAAGVTAFHTGWKRTSVAPLRWQGVNSRSFCPWPLSSVTLPFMPSTHRRERWPESCRPVKMQPPQSSACYHFVQILFHGPVCRPNFNPDDGRNRRPDARSGSRHCWASGETANAHTALVFQRRTSWRWGSKHHVAGHRH